MMTLLQAWPLILFILTGIFTRRKYISYLFKIRGKAIFKLVGDIQDPVPDFSSLFLRLSQEQ